MNSTKPSQSASKLSRRSFMIGLPVVLAACQTTPPPGQSAITTPTPSYSSEPLIDQGYASMYGPVGGEPFPISAIDLKKINPRYYRQMVDLPSGIQAQPGTIVVDPYNHFLYLVYENGRALRYGVGVGREGFAWSGDATIQAKQQWPKWHPPKEMQARDPAAAKWPDGMPGGPTNPLGARALYLYQGNVDTLYRIHGTTQPWSIGKSLSSGCIRMMNQDILDLYSRAPIGTKVKVLGNSTPEPVAASEPKDDAAPKRGRKTAQNAAATPAI
ncbi:L,D-transpeptidase [Kaistia adipata]|uniref:L,D-transpeptidase n=1 Tax=Kaistia adipata TaxID=166954 RepID=UPI000A019246|nr:L,D-transpeptidase [Kaistia adipata]